MSTAETGANQLIPLTETCQTWLVFARCGNLQPLVMEVYRVLKLGKFDLLGGVF